MADNLDITVSGRIAANGTGELAFPRGSRGQDRIVKQVSHNGVTRNAVGTILTTVGPNAVCNLVRNGAVVAQTLAVGSVIGGDPPVKVRQSDTLSLRYSNAVPNAAIEATFFYDEVDR